MKQKFGIGYLEKLLNDMDTKVRNEIADTEDFIARNPNSEKETRQSLATKQGRLMATKEIRKKIAIDTGLEMDHTKAPKDVRK